MKAPERDETSLEASIAPMQESQPGPVAAFETQLDLAERER
jgi:hypothetical protein